MLFGVWGMDVDMLSFPALHKMCCDLAGSVGSRQHWLWDIARKRNEFLLFSIILRTLQLLIALEPLYRFKWSFQQNVPLQEFQLITLDRIKNIIFYCILGQFVLPLCGQRFFFFPVLSLKTKTKKTIKFLKVMRAGSWDIPFFTSYQYNSKHLNNYTTYQKCFKTKSKKPWIQQYVMYATICCNPTTTLPSWGINCMRPAVTKQGTSCPRQLTDFRFSINQQCWL